MFAFTNCHFQTLLAQCKPILSAFDLFSKKKTHPDYSGQQKGKSAHVITDTINFSNGTSSGYKRNANTSCLFHLTRKHTGPAAELILQAELHLGDQSQSPATLRFVCSDPHRQRNRYCSLPSSPTHSSRRWKLGTGVGGCRCRGPASGAASLQTIRDPFAIVPRTE